MHLFYPFSPLECEMRTALDLLSHYSSSFTHAKICAQNSLTSLFKSTLEPLIGSILKICLYREAYLTGPTSRWVILPVVKTIGNLWFRLQGLPRQFTTFDQERLKKTETELLAIGQKELLPVKQDKLITLAHFKVNPSLNSTCILYLNGFGLPYQTAKKFIHKHIAAGFDFAVFEWGNKVSIKDFIEDAEAAFQTLLSKGYRPDQIKILGYCGTTYVATYLKLKHHNEGVDAILINPHTSFRDIVEKANRIGLFGLGAITTDEHNLDNEITLRMLSESCASTCLVIDPKNSITPTDTVERLQTALHQSGHTTVLTDKKFNKQFEDPAVWDRYVQFLKRNSRNDEAVSQHNT